MVLNKGVHKFSDHFRPGDELVGESRMLTLIESSLVYEGIDRQDTYVGGKIENLTILGDLTLYQTRAVSVRDVTVTGRVILDGGIEGSAYNQLQNVVARKGFVLQRTNPDTENPWTNINRMWGVHCWGADVGLDLISGVGNEIHISVGGCRVGVHLHRGADVNRIVLMEEYSKEASVIVERNAMRNHIVGSWQRSKMILPPTWSQHKTIIGGQFPEPSFETGEIRSQR